MSFNAPTLSGTSNIPSLKSFNIGSELDRNTLRGYANLADIFTIDDNKTLTTGGYIATPAYGSDLDIGATVELAVSF